MQKVRGHEKLSDDQTSIAVVSNRPFGTVSSRGWQILAALLNIWKVDEPRKFLNRNMVSFLSIFSLILETCKSEWHNRGPSKDFLVEFWYEMQDYLTLRKQDFGFILVFALLISLFRQQTTTRLLKVRVEFCFEFEEELF